MISKDQALTELHVNLSNKNLIKHCLATEAVMGGLYDLLTGSKGRAYTQTREEWSLAGLLHDLDYEQVAKDEYKNHGLVAADQLGDLITLDMRNAIASHGCEFTGVLPKSDFDFCLRSGETLTGLVVASALVLPSKKLAELTVGSILNRFKEKSFAKGASREVIMKCLSINLELEELIRVSLEAMQSIASELGL